MVLRSPKEHEGYVPSQMALVSIPFKHINTVPHMSLSTHWKPLQAPLKQVPLARAALLPQEEQG